MQADSGIVVDTDVSTTGGSLYLDGEMSGVNLGMEIAFGHGQVASAQSVLTLDVSTGSITAAGSLTLRAGQGIVPSRKGVIRGALSFLYGF